MSADRFVLDSAAQDLLFRTARTAKTFTDEPVSDEQVAAIYDLVQWGPTMTNSQPLRIVQARSDDARARVVSHMLPNNADKTAKAPLIAVLAAIIASGIYSNRNLSVIKQLTETTRQLGEGT